MKLATYNIQYGTGRDGKFDLPRIAASIEGADIIALQEVTRNFPRNGGADLVAGLSALLPDHFQVFGAAMDIDLGVVGVTKADAAQRFQFGNMVLSRWPIAAVRNLLLPRSRRFSSANLQRAALETLIITPSGPLRVYSVHLDHLSHEERIRQIRHLKERAYAYPSEGGAMTGAAEFGFPDAPCPDEFIIMGDFNMVRGSPEYTEMTGANDDGIKRHTVWHNPVDAFVLGDELPPDATTWGDDAHPGISRVIDFAFVHPLLESRVRDVRIDTAARGSDHFPVWLELD